MPQSPTAVFSLIVNRSSMLTLFCLRAAYTIKNVCISTDILWWVFLILTEAVPYTFVSVNRRNNEARAHIAMQTYTEPLPLKYGKLATKYPWIYGYFLQCTALALGHHFSNSCRICACANVRSRDVYVQRTLIGLWQSRDRATPSLHRPVLAYTYL